MNLLLLGGDGQVGWELRRSLALLGEVVAPDAQQADLTRTDALAALVRELRPDAVVNAAAYTAVDRAESEPDQEGALRAGFGVGRPGHGDAGDVGDHLQPERARRSTAGDPELGGFGARRRQTVLDDQRQSLEHGSRDMLGGVLERHPEEGAACQRVEEGRALSSR